MIVQCMGGVFRISKHNFKKYLHDRSLGKEGDLEEYGAKRIAVKTDYDVTDMSNQEAEDVLADLEAETGSK